MIRTVVVDDDFRVADLHCAYVERVRGFCVAGRATLLSGAINTHHGKRGMRRIGRYP